MNTYSPIAGCSRKKVDSVEYFKKNKTKSTTSTKTTPGTLIKSEPQFSRAYGLVTEYVTELIYIIFLF